MTLTEDVSVNRLANVVSIQFKKGEAYEAHEEKVRADTDSITEYAINRFYPVVKEAILFHCVHRSQGNCPSCFQDKVKTYSQWAAEKGWALTKQYGHLRLSEETKKLMG